MRKKFVSYLRCPVSGERLELVVLEESADHVTAGLLTTAKSWYPIIGGIPRLLLGGLKTTLLQNHHDFLTRFRNKLPAGVIQEWQGALDAVPDFDAFLSHQTKTAESFAYEWQHIYQENTFEKANFFHFLSPFIKEKDLHDKVTLDVGCGSGRFTKWAALSGARIAFGSDLGETVEVAYGMTKNLPNTCIVQADIYDMPFTGTFDLAYSIGVLHHLPSPREGFTRLPKVLQKGGQLLIWVYNRRGNARAIYLYEPLRALARSIPRPLLYRLGYLPAALVHSLNFLTVLLRRVGQAALAKRVPFSYYANFPFNMKVNDAFDVLATPKSNYYYKEEAEDWFKSARLAKIKSYEHPEAGITAIGRYD